ncbi:MAG: zinc ribbon domain-containing protein [Ignisphaera sp.]
MREGEAVYVNPMRTSSTCPRCGNKLRGNGSRVLRCTRCRFTGDGDVIACINLFIRHARCGVPGVILNTPKGDADPRPMQEKRDETMIPPDINLYKSRTPVF